MALVLCSALPASPGRAGAPALEPPSQEEIAEARSLVEAMKQAPRGPYKQLRWWCKDGTVLPPKPYACREHGGGHQHAEYSTGRERLAELGWHVGTIFTPLSWEELFQPGRRSPRLRELPLERYLVDVDDGWVLRKAQFYRGRVQVEDEEHFGSQHLHRLLSRPDWVRENFLLARESVRVIPHRSAGGDRTREVRRLSKELAELDPSFENLRIKIHTRPGRGDVDETRRWIEERRSRLPAAQLEMGRSLVEGLERLYGDAQRRERLAAAREAFRGKPFGAELERLLDGAPDASPLRQVARSSELLARIRDEVSGSGDAASNLLLVHVSLEAEEVLRQAAFELVRDPRTSRSVLLQAASHLVDAGHGAGFLSPREREALKAPVDALPREGLVDVERYVAAARGLERAGAWALSSVRHAFAEPLARYVALEPKAAQFPDDLLRGSALLPLADAASALARDAERLSGLRHAVFGRELSGLAGLNPGAAEGTLRVLTEADLARPAVLAEDDVVVLPRTVSDLPPVAGILTVAEGNVLSHVQVLARNLGIPNAALPPSAARDLAAHDGERVLLAVDTDGAVVLESWARAPAAARRALSASREDEAIEGRVRAPLPDLSVREPLPLEKLSSELSGRVVGPKAANLGELWRLYPDAVAPAVALPFGLFAEHAAGPGSPKERLETAFARHRRGELDASELASEVEAVRRAVEGLELSVAARERLLPVMRRELGPPDSYGLFIRSDTNVEDLPGFTGAGLNKTLPHVVGLHRQLEGIPRVWASPFRQRAMQWRARALENPEDVFTSVLLMKSVPATKSGVLVTKDLVTGGEGLTVASAWGVGGAVDGESAETLVLRPDGTTTLVGDAKAPWARRLADEGGIEWVPAADGTVLTKEEQDRLRELAASLQARLPTSLTGPERDGALDVELGFLDGRLVLFQVRPLVERGAEVARRVVAAMAPPSAQAATRVSLELPPGGPAATGS